ncbi:Uncharacterised protein [Xylophilus ampelinus]|nr:Uncharacterised protein [Xylophilus ampelinus]
MPAGVSITTGVVPRACSWASVTTVPPTVTLRSPSGVLSWMLPVVRSEVSGPAGPSTRPRSFTSAWPAALPLPSTTTRPGPLPASVWPWMVMVRVLVEVSPSASVMV